MGRAVVAEREPGLMLPRETAFAGVSLLPNGQVKISVLNGRLHQSAIARASSVNIRAAVSGLVPDVKVVAVGISGANGRGHDLGSDFWGQEDAVPVLLGNNFTSGDTAEIARHVSDRFTQDGLPFVMYGPNNEIIPSDLASVSEYQHSDPFAFEEVEWLAHKLKGKKIVHFSSTPQGGGVALMRHAEVRLARQMGIDVHWHTMTADDPRVFDVTKQKFHNTFQGVANNELTPEDKWIYEDWIAKNAEVLRPAYEHADVVVIDDYQPSGLIPYILKVNPNAKILYRSHIQIRGDLTDTSGTPQQHAWDYLWSGDGTKNSGIQAAHGFVSHPMKEFVPGNVPVDRVIAMGATTDRFDGLNKPLTPDQMEYYMGEVDRLLVEQRQTPIDHERPYIAQIARFDPSKGISHLLDAFRQLWNKMQEEGKTLPQLVIAGHSAIDDPDGNRIYAEIMHILATPDYAHLAGDVKAIRVPHKDQPLNAILRGATIATQLSDREGFEVKVTEALMKGVPVIAAERGGIPLQIAKGSGFLVNPDKYAEESDYHAAIAEYMYTLLTNPSLQKRMSRHAIEHADPDFTTVQNLANWLYLSDEVLTHGAIKDGNFSYVPDKVREAYAAASLRRSSRTRKGKRS